MPTSTAGDCCISCSCGCLTFMAAGNFKNQSDLRKLELRSSLETFSTRGTINLTKYASLTALPINEPQANSSVNKPRKSSIEMETQ